MDQFQKNFKKVDGINVLKQYKKSRVLFFALVETAILGFSKKSLEIVRLAVSNRIYSRLKKKNLCFIENFKKDFKSYSIEKKYNPTIWTIWLQGMDQAPIIVQKCYESIKSNITDRPIIVVTEENFKRYVTFPDYIIEKYEKGIISKVHFADLLRIELLSVHGGTWLDGTVYCSGYLDSDYKLESELFLFQMLKPGLDGHSVSISSWMMTAYSGNEIILLTRALLHNYWKNNDYAVDYFILHDFFQMAIESYPDIWNKVIPVSNSLPHILLLRLFDQFDEKIWNAVKTQTNFHKLSYKFEIDQVEIQGTYYDVLFNESSH